MAGLTVDDGLICEAYIWALDKYRGEHQTRGFRLFTDEDFDKIYKLKSQLAHEWQAKKYYHRENGLYHQWRRDRMNKLMTERQWSQETRDLYASILSTLQTWQRRGQNQKTKDRLKVLYPGASLLLQFLDRFPPKLTTKGVHDANPL
jgi:hypothetical protein